MGTCETTDDREEGNDHYDELELTLALPGESRKRKLGTKSQFSDVVYLKPYDSKRFESDVRKHVSKYEVALIQGLTHIGAGCDTNENAFAARERVVGWPPMRSYRKNPTKKSSGKYIKAAVDGAPYLRKVNLESCTSYKHLFCALEDMFSCFNIRIVVNEKMTDYVNRSSERVPTYEEEDKDGDWMLVGDVPWKMFIETCKRIRLKKSAEAINQLDPRTLSKS